MTALKEYQRLESGGIWKPGPEAQRRDVVLFFGDATLVIADSAGRPLSHWSLAALERLNPGTRPALFAPDPEATETLEIEDDIMINALEKVRKSVIRARPRPGRLRQGITWGTAAVLLALTIFWLPGALRDQAMKVVPEVKRAEIGAALLGHIQRLTGPTCRGPLGAAALARLHDRIFGPANPGQIVIASSGVQGAIALPGGILLIDRSLVEGFEDPAVVAGFALAAALDAQAQDPLRAVLDDAGLLSTLKLLATGDLPGADLESHAAALLSGAQGRPDDDALLAGFAAASLPSTPYAHALDPSGESVLGLIEADPLAGETYPLILSDGDWVALQGICAN